MGPNELRGGRAGRRRTGFDRCGLAVLLLLVVIAAGVGDAFATHYETTLTKTIKPENNPFIKPRDDTEPLFFELTAGKGSSIVVREDLAEAEKGRRHRRRSLFYFAQLTDFQLADEESPARVEFFDDGASGSWRPQEAFHPSQSTRASVGSTRSPTAAPSPKEAMADAPRWRWRY
jgi:hypothetical protein